MKYLLLKDMTGVIRDRSPEVSGRILKFEFDQAPAGALAVFKTNRGDIYLALQDGCCELDSTGLIGEIGVTVAVFDGTAEAQRWQCEGIILYSLTDGNLLLVPHDGNLSQTVAIMHIRLDACEETNRRLTEEISKLREEQQKLMTGYNIV